MRVLITGASGFAGGYLVRACSDAGDEVLGVSRSGVVADDRASRAMALDVRDLAALRAVLRDFSPEVVYHLAALSSVGQSWEEPAVTVEDNVASAVSMLEGLRAEAPRARVVWVSSCQVYGSAGEEPIREDGALAPANPYAVSKATGDLLAGCYAEAHGLAIVRARPFNHSGPGQQPSFILSSIARQAAEARRAGASTVKIVTGNPDARRDFIDVRDVVRAYRLLAQDAAPGIYNISSGVSVSAAEQVRLLGELLAPLEVEHVVEPSLVRGVEVMHLIGDNSRLRAATGWNPEIPLRQTLLDTVAWWDRELDGRGARPSAC